MAARNLWRDILVQRTLAYLAADLLEPGVHHLPDALSRERTALPPWKEPRRLEQGITLGKYRRGQIPSLLIFLQQRIGPRPQFSIEGSPLYPECFGNLVERHVRVRV